jgi:hypothetical protein
VHVAPANRRPLADLRATLGLYVVMPSVVGMLPRVGS